MTQEEFLGHVAHCLDEAGIPFMLAGSHASTFHGLPRATQDVDLVIEPSAEQLDRFLALLGPSFYASHDAAHEALAARSMFNIIDVPDGWKADLIIRKERPFSVEEFGRRRSATLSGRTLSVASPEDVILTKLEWNKITPSERQVQDALNVAIIQWSRLDQDYLQKWAPSLGVSHTLEDVLRQARASNETQSM
jgi:hypothetical protein